MKYKLFGSDIRILVEPKLRDTLCSEAKRRNTTLSELTRALLRDGLRQLQNRDNLPAGSDARLAA